MNKEPSVAEMLEVLRNHFGIQKTRIFQIFNVPTHPHTLLDDFAGQAMQGFLSRENSQYNSSREIAELSYAQAQAMIDQRVKK